MTTRDTTATYTLWDWTVDDEALEAGSPPQPCPKCNRTGFYGPRAHRGQKYRSCWFCGFFQELDKEPEYWLPTVHGCPKWPSVAGAPYIWWVPPDQRVYECHYCLRELDVEAAQGPNPYLHGDHPWWKVPQNKSHHRYVKFWERWPKTRGRSHL